MNLDEDLTKTDEGLEVSSLIDVVFLLLIYFMVTASLKKSEADLGITLPGLISQSKEVNMPDEQIIEVQKDGTIILNNTTYGTGGSKRLPKLEATLKRYVMASKASKSKAMVTIQADDETMHERCIDVMNACKAANIKHMTFGM